MLVMTGKSPYEVVLTEDQRHELERRAAACSGPYRDVVCAKAVLYEADGMSNAEIARRLDQPHQAVSEWRKRFCQEGRVDRVDVDRVMDAARRVVLVGGEPAEPTARRRRHAGCTPTR